MAVVSIDNSAGQQRSNRVGARCRSVDAASVVGEKVKLKQERKQARETGSRRDATNPKRAGRLVRSRETDVSKPLNYSGFQRLG